MRREYLKSYLSTCGHLVLFYVKRISEDGSFFGAWIAPLFQWGLHEFVWISATGIKNLNSQSLCLMLLFLSFLLVCSILIGYSYFIFGSNLTEVGRFQGQYMASRSKYVFNWYLDERRKDDDVFYHTVATNLETSCHRIMMY